MCLRVMCWNSAFIGFVLKGLHWRVLGLYHLKMSKLLAKEGNVTKVPVHTYGERERERDYWRMENDFPAEEKLPTEGGIKKDTFPLKLWRSCGIRDGIVYTLSWFLNAECSPSMNACADITILNRDNYNTLKKLKDLKHVNFKAKIAYRYCKSQTIAVFKGISILIII